MTLLRVDYVLFARFISFGSLKHVNKRIKIRRSVTCKISLSYCSYFNLFYNECYKNPVIFTTY
jgi:hypothetical protein